MKHKKHKQSAHNTMKGGGKMGAHPSHAKMNKAHGTPGGFDAGEEYGGSEHDKGLCHDGTCMTGTSMTAGAGQTPGQSHYMGSEGQGVPNIESNSSEG